MRSRLLAIVAIASMLPGCSLLGLAIGSAVDSGNKPSQPARPRARPLDPGPYYFSANLEGAARRDANRDDDDGRLSATAVGGAVGLAIDLAVCAAAVLALRDWTEPH